MKLCVKTINTLLIFALMLLCIPSTQVNASEFDENASQQLSHDEMEILNELYEIDPDFTYEGELVSVSKTTENLETQDNYFQNFDEFLTGGSIGSNYMTIIVTVARVTESGKDTFNISATATWKIAPAFRMEDAFALSWDENFALIDSSATTSYKSMGITPDKTEVISQSPNRGIGYSVQCSHYYGQTLDWVRINATISKYNSNGITNVCAAYCHRKVSLGDIGIHFDSGTDISFSVTGALDQMNNSTSFSY